MHPVDACPQARLNMKPAGVGIVFQREETLDHNGLVVRASAATVLSRCSGSCAGSARDANPPQYEIMRIVSKPRPPPLN
jgi:hypothetical protein